MIRHDRQELPHDGQQGVIVCGERVDYAYDDLYYLERACQAQVMAASTGVP